jgi:hypothetical protein
MIIAELPCQPPSPPCCVYALRRYLCAVIAMLQLATAQERIRSILAHVLVLRREVAAAPQVDDAEEAAGLHRRSPAAVPAALGGESSRLSTEEGPGWRVVEADGGGEDGRGGTRTLTPTQEAGGGVVNDREKEAVVAGVHRRPLEPVLV